MEATRHLVATAAKLAAGVEHGHRHLETRLLLFRMDVDRNAASVVLHRCRAVGMQGHDDRVSVPSHRLVDGVVDDFVQEMVQAPGIG